MRFPIAAVAQDLRYGVRLLARSPAFVVTAVLSLAIGIAANAAIFSVANALLLRPLPGVERPSRLVDVGRTTDGRGFDTTSFPNYRDIRDRTTTLAGLVAWRVEPEAMSLAGDHDADRVYGTRVTGNFFSVIGASAQRGRLFGDVDDQPGRNQVLVMSDELWRVRYAADPGIVGRTLLLNGRSFVVIGVAAPGFHGTTLLKSDLWVPLSTQVLDRTSAALTNRQITWLFMFGRLKPGVTVQQANAELAAIGERLAHDYPKENGGRGLRVLRASILPGRTDVVAGFLGVLMAIVGLILLITCVNLTGMLLARGAVRQREIAIRLAVGAGRGRLVRQLLTETATLFAAGCTSGLILSRWFIALLLELMPQLPVPVDMQIAIDWRVTIFAIAVALAAAIAAGLAPALQATQVDLVPSLKADAAEGGPSRLRLRSAFLVGQITLSLLLVVAGGLLVRALARAGRIDPGFDQTNVDVVSLDLSLAGYKEADGLVFTRDLIERTRRLPGVSNAVVAADLPLDGSRMSFGDVRPSGAPGQGNRRAVPVDWNVVTPGFFQTLRVTLKRGRDFGERDTAKSPRVVIVNETLGRMLFGPDDPLGREVDIDPGDARTVQATVVGVAADAQLVELGESIPYVYAPLAQEYQARVSLLVRSTGGSSIPFVRGLVRTMNPQLPVVEAMPMRDVTAISLVPQRIAAAVAGTLGIVGLALAAIGIYGVTSYTVNRRTREIGIRMALGAGQASVVSLMLRQGVALALVGVAAGLVLAVVATSVLRTLLFGLSAADPLTFVSAALLFVGVALVASYLPARRAARVDPIQALRTT